MAIRSYACSLMGVMTEREACFNSSNRFFWSFSIKYLIEKYENDDTFECNRIVIFGYSFNLNEIQTLKDNLKQVKNIKNINVDFITRY